MPVEAIGSAGVFFCLALRLTPTPLPYAAPPVATRIAPPSSWRRRSSTFTRASSPSVLSGLSLSASTRMAREAFDYTSPLRVAPTASTRLILPLCLAAAWPTSEAW